MGFVKEKYKIPLDVIIEADCEKAGFIYEPERNVDDDDGGVYISVIVKQGYR